jgi:hypothetical protein
MNKSGIVSLNREDICGCLLKSGNLVYDSKANP